MQISTAEYSERQTLTTSIHVLTPVIAIGMETVTPAVRRSVLLNSDTDRLGKENHPTKSGCTFGGVHAPWII